MRQKNIFHDTSLKLTAIYLSIIMVISLLFSFGLYRVSAQEVERGIRQRGPVGQVLRSRNAELIQDLIDEQNEIIDEAKRRIQSSLVLINLFILVGGGFLSYYFAKRTLRPIEEAHEAQSRFTADASHELRTPITAMRAEAELALTDDTLTLKKARGQLKSSIEELDKLAELSEGLLQLAHLDNNDVEKDIVTVSHIITQAIDSTQAKLAQKSQTITVKKISESNVYGNQPALVRAIATLLDNAIKYSPEKSEISVSAQKQKNTVCISISDTGPGIRASEIPHIFDRFYRADSSRTKNTAHGYGIGLSIAKAIVDLHAGKITVKSTPGNGSTFTISLPIA